MTQQLAAPTYDELKALGVECMKSIDEHARLTSARVAAHDAWRLSGFEADGEPKVKALDFDVHMLDSKADEFLHRAARTLYRLGVVTSQEQPS